MNIYAVMPVKGRLPLLKLTVSRLVRQGVNVVCAGHTEQEKDICTQAGAYFIMTPYDITLGKKWQMCVDFARTKNPDALMMMGSSDMVEDNWVKTMYKDMINYDAAMVGTQGCYFLDIQPGNKKEMIYWGGYTNYRRGEPIGTGRLVSRKALDLIKWKVFDITISKSMDRAMVKSLISVRDNFKELIHCNKDMKCLSISTYRWINLHNFNQEKETANAKVVDADKVISELFSEMDCLFPNDLDHHRKYSVIIPTLWYSRKIYRQIEIYDNSTFIDEILIIDNDPKQRRDIHSSKIRFIPQKENIYVNPAWNLGVKEAKNDWVIIANDDINVCRLSELLVAAENTNYDLIGADIERCKLDSDITFKEHGSEEERPWGWGCLLIVNKNSYIPIPETLKIWCGDDLRFNTTKNKASFGGVRIDTVMGETVDRFRYKATLDRIVYEQKYLEISKASIVPYTAIIGDYDAPRKDLLCFTDYDRFTNAERNSRIYFILPHKFIDCDISILVSADTKVLIPYQQLVEEWLEDYDMVLFKHPWRDCVLEEIKAAETQIKRECEMNILRAQGEHYRKIGIPEHIGNLPETAIIIRRHNKIVKQFCEAWWAEMCRWSYRDQCSFPVVLQDYPELKVRYIEPNVRVHPYFNFNPNHAKYKV
jgi:hypothetical protein